jgi:signal peptidase II
MTSKKIIIFIIIVFFLVSVDLFIKIIIEKNLVQEVENFNANLLSNEMVVMFYQDPEKKSYLIKEIVVVKNFWSFIYIRNYNIGFSLLSFLENHFSSQTLVWFFKFLQLFGVLLITSFFFYQHMQFFLAFSLMISGGSGNVVDRFLHGYVIDYIKWYIPNSPIAIFDPWPIFNLADVYVTCGSILLFIQLFFTTKKKKTYEKKH